MLIYFFVLPDECNSRENRLGEYIIGTLNFEFAHTAVEIDNKHYTFRRVIETRNGIVLERVITLTIIFRSYIRARL